MMKLSKIMKNALLGICDDGGTKHSKSTIQALIDRGLLDDSGNMTQDGYDLAISYIPLKKQAEKLNVPICEVFGAYDSRPEQFLWDHFRKQGFDGSYCEGGAFLTLLKSAALPILAKINTFNSRNDACSRFLEAQFTIHKDKSEKILQAINKAKAEDIRSNFQEIYQQLVVLEFYPGLYTDFMEVLFESAGTEVLCDVARLLFKDPYQYRNGWPDLTLVKDGQIWLIEVKTTDKLHLSQIKTIPRLLRILPAKILVMKLKRNDKTQIPELGTIQSPLF